MKMEKEEWRKRQKLRFLLLLMDEAPYAWAVDKAYLTFCRVLGGYTEWEKKNCKQETPKGQAREHLIKELSEYCALEAVTEEEFKEWHKALSKKLCEYYEEFNISKREGKSDEPIRFTYGCAQKWINMALKFLYSVNDFADYLGVQKSKADFRYCHIPIDNYVIDNAEEFLQVKPSWKVKWSKLDSYDQYLKYEETLREKVPEEFNLLDLDFALWGKDDPEKVREGLERLGIKLS